MIPFLLAAGATLLKANAGYKAGKAEVAAGKKDLESAILSGHFREKGLKEKRDRTLGEMRARSAASGVEMSGSALEVLLNSSAQAERDLIISRIVTENNKATARQRMVSGQADKQNAYLEGLLGLGSAAMKTDWGKLFPEGKSDEKKPDEKKPGEK